MTGLTSITNEQVHVDLGRAVSRNAHTVSSGLEIQIVTHQRGQ